MQTIFETRRVGAPTAAVSESDLRFQWHVEAEIAVRKLEGMIEFLSAEQEVDERLAELNAKLMADEKLDSYDAIEAERRILREQRHALINMGYELGLDAPAEARND
ncbi:hypothetical protein AB5I41_04340 [Sphingomonas sp. MMS24-JH45]